MSTHNHEECADCIAREAAARREALLEAAEESEMRINLANRVTSLEAKVARVEALASGLQEQYEASDYSETASLGEMVKAIRTALAEPGRDEEGGR
jgi:uncharacterized protein YhaN